MAYKPTPKGAKWTKLAIPIQPLQSAWLEITTSDSLKFYIAELSIQPESANSDFPKIAIEVPHMGKNLWELSSHMVSLKPQDIAKLEETRTEEGDARYRLQLPEAEIFSESPAPPQWPRLITK